VHFKEEKQKKPNSSNLSHSMLKYLDNSIHQDEKFRTKSNDWEEIFQGRKSLLILDENDVKDNFKIRHPSRITEEKVQR
jgi:carboxylesterase type B